MKMNVGIVDRIFRVIVGLVVLGAGYHFRSWWGLVGIPPLLTGLIGYCPGYVPFGLSTCPARKSEPPAGH
jgi:hypothetical protein